jgi:predicted ATPase/DNA-binding SARP family transcriptional activator
MGYPISRPRHHAFPAAQLQRPLDEPTSIPQAQVSLVRVLGPLALDLGGTEVRLKRQKPREIFLLLLLHRGKRLHIRFIADALWGAHVPVHPHEAVRSYLSSVRGWIAAWPPEVSGPVLRSQAGAYGLDLDDDHLDLAQFTRLAERGQLALSEGLAAAGLRDLDEALALFRGVALQDAANCTFAISEITRLEDMRLEAREARALALLELDLSDSAIAALWDLAHEYPCRIRSAALLMVSLYRARRQVEALECAQTFRRALWTELGERPDASFLALEQAILKQDAELDGPALIRTAVFGDREAARPTLVMPNGGRISRTVAGQRDIQIKPRRLFGRAEAENALVSMLESNPDVSIVGPVGCGKSALAVRVAARFRDEMNAHVGCVDVRAVSGPAELRQTIGRCLDDLALRAQHERDGILLVLDNCEALQDAMNHMGDELIGHLLPGLRVLRTSRRRDQAGSVLYGLEPLPPTTHAGPDSKVLLASPAMALFCQRAAATRRGFEPRPEHIPAIARICEAVDRLPLAIEMAAAQTLVVNPVELEPLVIDDPFSVLKFGRQENRLPATLHAAYRRTYEQLTSSERKMLLRFAQIGHPFTLGQAASAGKPAGIVASALDALVTHSVVALDHSGGSPRFRMLRTWRVFAQRVAAHAG